VEGLPLIVYVRQPDIFQMATSRRVLNNLNAEKEVGEMMPSPEKNNDA